ncbi:MAG: GntR family transcriptional regulator [Gammaproteobacteria bacterium]|jgi:DNA-binding GntR family transcriptional regulator|nr:GntR family transcriptional regulator [Gammaproteobacteria bacterium]
MVFNDNYSSPDQLVAAVKETGPNLDIYRQLFDCILEQRLAPNTKLNEQDLAQVFGVSRTLIRQSLQRLAAEQVVVMHKNRGAYVAAPDFIVAQQILDARELIELAVVDLACGSLGAQEIEALKLMITLEQEALDQGDTGTALRRSGEFHLRLAQAAGNQPYVHMLRGLISQTSLIIAMYGQGGNTCARDEHNELIAALVVGDKSLSSSLMRHHLAHIRTGCDFNRRVNSGSLAMVLR